MFDNSLNWLYDPAAAIDDGGAEVEDSGFELSLSNDLSNSTAYSTTGAESFAEALSSLIEGTTHCYCTFVETMAGRAEGTIQSFTTVDDAAVSPLSATSIGASLFR